MIDDFDKKILRLMQSNARQTAEQISELIGLSAPACQRRIKRLRDEGYIAREVAVLSDRATGGHMTFIVQVAVSNQRTMRLDLFRRQLLADDNVQQCFHVTGEVDFILIVTARSMAHFEEIADSLLVGNDCIDRFHTSVSYSVLKQSLSAPI